MKIHKGGEIVSHTAREGTLRMRWKRQALVVAVAAASVSFVMPSFGAAIEKANNNTALSVTTSWVGSVVPTAADTAVFDSVQTTATSTSLGAPLSFLGIQITNPGGSVTLTDSGPNSLTLGASGIDMTLASQNLTLALPVVLGAAQDWHLGTGTTLVASGTIDTTGGTLTVRGAGNTTLSGTISGANGLTKFGGGSLTLSHAELYTGTTTVGGGTFVMDFSGAGVSTNLISPSSAVVFSGGTLKFNGAGTQTFASTSVQAGNTTLDAGGGTLNLGAITRVAGGTVRFTPGSTYTTTTAGQSPGGILEQGTNNGPYATWGLTDYAANDGSGNIVGGDSVASFYTLGVPSTGAQNFPGNVNFDIGSVAGLYRSNTNNPSIGRIRFNSSTGGVTTRDGNTGAMFVVRNTNVVNIASILVTPNVGTTDVFFTDDTTINNTGPRIANSDMVLWQNNTSGFLVFNVGITSTGTGSVVKAGAGTVIMNGANTYGLNTYVNEGTLELGNRVSLGQSSTASTTVNGGNILSLINFEYTSNGLNTGNARSLVLGGAGGTLAASTLRRLDVAGVVSGPGGVTIGMGATDATNNPGATATVHTTVNGDGTVVFGGANTYTGTTNVAFGTLQVSNTTGSGTGTGNVIVKSGATIAGGGTIGGNVVVQAGGKVAPGDAISINPAFSAPNVGTLTVAGRLTLDVTDTFNFEPGDVISANGFSFTNTTSAGSTVIPVNIFSPGLSTAFFGGGTFKFLTDTSGPLTAAITSHFTSASIQNGAPATNGYSYTFSQGTGISANSLFLTIVSPAITSRWIGADGNWAIGVEGNWQAVSTSASNTSKVPQHGYDTANFDGGGSTNVTINSALSVGFLNLSNASYNIAGSATGTLTMDALGVEAQVTDISQSQTIAANLVISSGTPGVRFTTSRSIDTLLVSGNITGAGGGTQTLSTAGVGTVVLTGTNSYGATSILGGTLQVGNGGTGGSLGSSLFGIVDNGLLRLDVNPASGTLTIGAVISGSGSVEDMPSSLLVLASANTFTGGLKIDTGTVQLGTGSSTGTGLVTLRASSALDINGQNATLGGVVGSGIIQNLASTNSTLTISQTSNGTLDGSILQQTAGIITLVKVGTAKLTLSSSSSSTYTGATIINAGAIDAVGAISNTLILGTTGGSVGQLRLENGHTYAGTVTLNAGANDGFDYIGTSPGQFTLSGAITATTGTAYQMGVANDQGTLTLAGANSANGNVANLSQGVINFAPGSSLTDTGGAIRMGTSSFAIVNVAQGASITSTLASGDALTLGTGGAGDPNNAFGNTLTIGGTGGVGQAIVNLGGATLNLQGTTFDSLADGTIQTKLFLNANSILTLGTIHSTQGSNSSVSNFYFNGGTLVAGADNTYFTEASASTIAGNLRSGAFLDVAGGAGAIIYTDLHNTFNSVIAHVNLSGPDSADGGLTKLGVGTLTLSNDNSFTGPTSVNAGLLILGGGSNVQPLGNSNQSLTVLANAELDLNGKNNQKFNVLSGGGIITQVNTTATLTETIGLSNGSGTFSGGIQNGPGSISILKLGTGTQTFTGSLNQFANLTVNAGVVRAGANGTFDSVGHIIVNSNSGLQIADGVSVNAVVQTNVTGEFADVPSGNGTIGGPVTVLSGNYVAGITGTGSLTLTSTQGVTGLTTLSISRGNVNYAGNASMSASTAALTVGTVGTATSLGVSGNASLILGSLTLGQATGTQPTSLALNVSGGGFINLGTSTLNLYGGTLSTPVVTANLNGGTIQFAGFSRTGPAGAVNPINWNGTLLTATASNGTFLGGINANIGVGGAKLNTNTFNTTIGTTLTGLANDGGLNKQGVGTLTLSGAATYAGATSVTGGSLVFGNGTNAVTSHIGAVSGSGTLSVAANATLTTNGLTVATVQTAGQLTINGVSSVTNNANVSKVSSLTISTPTGHLELNNNKLIVETASGKSTVITNLKSWVSSANLTSTVVAADPTHRQLVIADNGLNTGGTATFTTFGGQSVTANSVLVMATLKGDANLDGKVTQGDYTIWADHLGASNVGWLQGDFNGDGTVTQGDYTIWADNFADAALPVLPGLQGAVVASPAAVPEPMTLSVLGLGAAALLLRRRSR